MALDSFIFGVIVLSIINKLIYNYSFIDLHHINLIINYDFM